MSTPKHHQLMGRIAVHLKMITMDQLSEAVLMQGRGDDSPRIGDIFVQKGWITPVQLANLVQYQKRYLERHKATGAARAGGPAPAAEPAPAASATRNRETVPSPTPPQAGAGTVPSAAVDPGAVKKLNALLQEAIEARASDLHLHSGMVVRLRVNGEFRDDGDTLLTGATVEGMLLGSMTPDQRAIFEQRGDLDYSYTLPGIGRFRANAYRQHRGASGVFRLIPPAPPTLADLGLPSSLAKLVNFHQGMVLITGPTGCGKSNTLAALVNILNEERRDHILTIEDPIEHLQPSKRCVVNQRQVNSHTESFSRALRAALREDPDVIVIGELRDRETISLALTAAETGHLVLASLHTNSAIRTINRILGVFPPNQQSQIRTMISESLRAIVSQRLVPTADRTRRVPALEILLVNKAVGNLIRDHKTIQIQSVLQTGAPHGMCLMENSLAALVKAGTITREEAGRLVEDPKRLAA